MRLVPVDKMSFVSMFSGFLLLNGLLFCLAAGNVQYYDFVLKETNFTRLCSTKSMLTVNDSFPGPVIKVHKGDTVFVNVHNQGIYGVTIHWHGVKQPRNPWHDGPENITQCPIKPGSNFTQEIIFSTEEGTLWWHAHSDWSRATVHGAIIIYPATGTTYPFSKMPDAEETLVLASWFNGDVMAIFEEAVESGLDFNISDAFTINGHPGYLYKPNCSSVTSYSMVINYGKTYLVRIINAVMNEEMFFAIANHTFTVVGSDGAYLKPITTSYMMIGPGQTMDILVTADQSLSHYYIVATPFANGGAPFDETTTSAIFEYSGNYTPPSSPYYPTTLPSYNDTDAAHNFTKQMKSLASKEHPVDVSKNFSTRVFMTVSTNRYNNKMSANLNNFSFVTPNVSILEAYYSQVNGVYTNDFPIEPLVYYNFTGDDLPDTYQLSSNGTRVIEVNYNESVEIVFQGTSMGAENHPFHLHGYSFYLVGTGYGNFDNVTHPQSYNLVDPPEVNTIGIPKQGWAAIRFIADNPGVWFMHCHLERHATWGMNTVLIVRNGSTNESKIRPPPNSMPPCN